MARFLEAIRHELLDAMTNNFNSATIRVYSGTRPTNANTALSGNTLLAQLTMNATSFPAASGGVLTANAITSDSSADATGTASFVRVIESGGSTVVGDFSVGVGSGECQLNTLSIVSGAVVSASSFTITFGVGA